MRQCLAKLSVAMTDEDGFSDDETLAFITTQISISKYY